MLALTTLVPCEKLSCAYVVGTTPVCEKVSRSSGTAGGVCSVVPGLSGLRHRPVADADRERRGDEAVEVEPPFALAVRPLAEGRGDAARQRRDLRARWDPCPAPDLEASGVVTGLSPGPWAYAGVDSSRAQRHQCVEAYLSMDTMHGFTTTC